MPVTDQEIIDHASQRIGLLSLDGESKQRAYRRLAAERLVLPKVKHTILNLDGSDIFWAKVNRIIDVVNVRLEMVEEDAHFAALNVIETAIKHNLIEEDDRDTEIPAA